MTDRELLLNAGLSEADFENMQDYGAEINIFSDVASLQRLATLYSDADMIDKALSLLDEVNPSVDYWRETVQAIAGASIEWNDVAERFYFTKSGHFAPDPYTERQLTPEQQYEEIYYRYLKE